MNMECGMPLATLNRRNDSNYEQGSDLVPLLSNI
jgi:hypothetical protein